MLKNASRGFSIIELIIAMGMGAIISGMAFYLLYLFNVNYTAIQNKIDTERQLIQATYNIQRVLSLAVNVNSNGTSPIPNSTSISTVQPGLITDYNATTMSGLGGVIETVAVFLRERGGYQPVPKGEYGPAAIFYSRPTPTKSGVLFLEVNSTGNMSPSWSSLFFDKVVEFSMTNFIMSTTAPAKLTSIEMSITMRNFLTTNVAGWNFCPAKDILNGIAGCNPATPLQSAYKDLNRKVRVTFSNQIILPNSPSIVSPTANSPYERTFGQLYLFPSQF